MLVIDRALEDQRDHDVVGREAANMDAGNRGVQRVCC